MIDKNIVEENIKMREALEAIASGGCHYEGEKDPDCGSVDTMDMPCWTRDNWCDPCRAKEALAGGAEP